MNFKLTYKICLELKMGESFQVNGKRTILNIRCDGDFLLKNFLLASCKQPPTYSLIMFYSTSVIMTEMPNNKIPIKSLNYVKSLMVYICIVYGYLTLKIRK